MPKQNQPVCQVLKPAGRHKIPIPIHNEDYDTILLGMMPILCQLSLRMFTYDLASLNEIIDKLESRDAFMATSIKTSTLNISHLSIRLGNLSIELCIQMPVSSTVNIEAQGTN